MCAVSLLCAGCICFFKQKTAYEMRISDWSSDVCSSDLDGDAPQHGRVVDRRIEREIDPGGDDPALVGPVEVDHVEGGRGAEIDHDQVARIALVRGDDRQSVV